VRLLLARGANQHYEPLYNGPIHEAAKLGHERIARIIVDHGADINGGWPAPLAAAAFLGQAHMVRFFLNMGADIATQTVAK
jgi:ankyrin repeat protein